MICWLLLLGLTACTTGAPSALVTVRQAMPPDQTQILDDVDAIQDGIEHARVYPNTMHEMRGGGSPDR